MAVDFQKRSGINLTKNDTSEGIGVKLDDKMGGFIKAELRWRSGMGSGRSDLDLFCWRVGSGSKGRKGGLRGILSKKNADLAEVIYHKNLGAADVAPYVLHGGDLRTPGVETIRAGHLEQHDYLLFGAYQAFGNGVGSLKSFNAHVVVTDAENNKVQVNLNQSHPNRYWATIVLVDFTHPEGYIVKPVEDYSRPGVESSPILHSDGRITMNEGPKYLFK